MILFYILVMLNFSYAADFLPLGDNVLFAFDKCKTITVDLKKITLEEIKSEAFDIHCQNLDRKLNFKCFFYDAGSNKKLRQEALVGGKQDMWGELSNQGGTLIRLSFEHNTAYFESPLNSSSKDRTGRKICAGIFIFEKEALKRKK